MLSRAILTDRLRMLIPTLKVQKVTCWSKTIDGFTSFVSSLNPFQGIGKLFTLFSTQSV